MDSAIPVYMPIPGNIPGSSTSRAQTLRSPSSTGLDAATFVGISQTLMVDGRLDMDAVGFLIRDTNSAISDSLQSSNLPSQRRAELLRELNGQFGNAGEAMTLSSLEDVLTALMIFQIQSAQDRKTIERRMNAESRSQLYQSGMETAAQIVEKGRLEAASMMTQAAIQFATSMISTAVTVISASKADAKKKATMEEIDAMEAASQPGVTSIDTDVEVSSPQKYSPKEINQMRQNAIRQYEAGLDIGRSRAQFVSGAGNFVASMVGGAIKMELAGIEGEIQRSQTMSELGRSLQQSVQGGIQDAAKAQETAMKVLEQILSTLHQGAMAIRIA